MKRTVILSLFYTFSVIKCQPELADSEDRLPTKSRKVRTFPLYGPYGTGWAVSLCCN